MSAVPLEEGEIGAGPLDGHSIPRAPLSHHPRSGIPSNVRPQAVMSHQGNSTGQTRHLNKGKRYQARRGFNPVLHGNFPPIQESFGMGNVRISVGDEADGVKESTQANEWSRRLVPEQRQVQLSFKPNAMSGSGIVTIPIEEVLPSFKKWENCVVGYFLGKKPAFSFVRDEAYKRWMKKGLEDVLADDKGTWIFKFSMLEESKEILELGHCHFGGRVMILKQWKPMMDFGKDSHTSVPIWIKVFNLPVELWEKGLSYVASAIGVPLYPDEATRKMERISFARMCVDVNVHCKFPKHCVVQVGDDTVEVQLEYQWVPQICGVCKVFGHQCTAKIDNIDGQVEADQEGWRSIQRGKEVNLIDELHKWTKPVGNTRSAHVNTDKEKTEESQENKGCLPSTGVVGAMSMCPPVEPVAGIATLELHSDHDSESGSGIGSDYGSDEEATLPPSNPVITPSASSPETQLGLSPILGLEDISWEPALGRIVKDGSPSSDSWQIDKGRRGQRGKGKSDEHRTSRGLADSGKADWRQQDGGNRFDALRSLSSDGTFSVGADPQD